MNSRERMIAAIEFRQPDKIPLYYHPSEAGLYVHGRKLLDLFRQIPGDNGVVFSEIPQPPPGTLDSNGQYHEFRQDAWGTCWEYLIFGIQGHPKAYPFSGWDEAHSYSLPPIPVQEVIPAEFRRDHYVFGGGGSIFEKPSSLRPFDEVIIDFFEENPELLEFVDRLVEYYTESNTRALACGVDIFCFGDDYGTQTGPFFPDDLFRRIFVPRYKKMFSPIQNAGRKILFHSCGRLNGVVDELFDLGIDVLWPQLSLYGRDEAFLDHCAERRVALLLHPDRQYLIPRGTPGEIRSWVRDMAARYRQGGGIFYVEMENDAPWENVKTLLESIAEYR